MPTTINKADQAYDKLERMITFQELEPGSMVSEGTLMELTGLGRSPVRDALQRLAWERMVEIHPRRGVIIPPISVEVQLKLLELRRSVEELAVRMASHRASPAQKRGDASACRGAGGIQVIPTTCGLRPAPEEDPSAHRSCRPERISAVGDGAASGPVPPFLVRQPEGPRRRTAHGSPSCMPRH